LSIRELTALELGDLIKKKKLSSTEAAKAFLDAAKQDLGKSSSDKSKINAFTEIYEESALAAAKAAEERIEKGETLSPIAGVPIVIKDNICSTEGHTTAASKILGGFRSPFDADAVERLRKAGAVIIGKANMDEFAMGNTTENSYYGFTRNPWNLDCVPGGSSGGSAAAVAAGLAPISLGSDTGGSVRQPCGFCNLTGIKPTYGSVSRYGLIAFASSLDQIGPMALDSRDCATLLSIISGRDERDNTSWNNPDKKGITPLKGRKIGLPTNYFEMQGLDACIKERVLEAADILKKLGADMIEIKLPLLEYTVPAYLVISRAEACSNLARYDGVKYGYRSKDAKTIEEVYAKSRGEGFGDEVKRRIIFGYHVLSSENFNTSFLQAQKARNMIKKEYDKALEDCDQVLTPVSPVPAYRIGEHTDDPVEMYIGDIYTASLNLAGLPGAAAPCGFDKNGMPVGMQLIGKRFEDELLLDTITGYQKETDYHKKRPPLFANGGER
jgi:aspartyl-tRNA(Asn)/glutamyl-tRNA(Gln) amidotransferase subunit A